MENKLVKDLDGLWFKKTPFIKLGQKINAWSFHSAKNVTVLNFYLNSKWVAWNGNKIWVVDYELFGMMVAQWVDSGMTREEALDLCFGMNV